MKIKHVVRESKIKNISICSLSLKKSYSKGNNGFLSQKQASFFSSAGLASSNSSKFSFKKSRSIKKSKQKSVVLNCNFNSDQTILSRHLRNNMKLDIEFSSRSKDLKNLRNSSATPNSTTSVSKRTQEFLPSFTFGSQGMFIEREQNKPQDPEVIDNFSEFEDFDSMANVFYQNSVSQREKEKNYLNKTKKLCLRKKLEKKIFKVKAKSIFKNLFFRILKIVVCL